MHPRNIKISDYSYDLPPEKIALNSLKNRDQSKLLLYKEGKISTEKFENISSFIPAESLLIFNNTKVINARLIFKRKTGAKIEIFCLEPHGSYELDRNESVWTCMVGNAKKWGDEILETIINAEEKMSAELLERTDEYFTIKFRWNNHSTFWEILDKIGQLPLPPYLKREVIRSDYNNYQTVYAKNNGSVAAPTAGLHFTPQVFDALHAKNIHTDELTLHVGAGTFKPVKSEVMEGHSMHAEYISFSKKNVEQLLKYHFRICVGTTSLRTLETIYWLGVKLLLEIPFTDLWISQWDPYEIKSDFSFAESLEAVKTYIGERDSISGKTEILIAPSYQIKSVDAIITNFHQPNSTLLLLVAAAVSEDWKNIYEYALQHNFRFLSYGDSSLLYLKK